LSYRAISDFLSKYSDNDRCPAGALLSSGGTL